jgi:hypothetical protein
VSRGATNLVGQTAALCGPPTLQGIGPDQLPRTDRTKYHARRGKRPTTTELKTYPSPAYGSHHRHTGVAGGRGLAAGTGSGHRSAPGGRGKYRPRGRVMTLFRTRGRLRTLFRPRGRRGIPFRPLGRLQYGASNSPSRRGRYTAAPEIRPLYRH